MKIKKTLVAALLMVAAVSYGQNNNYIGQDYSVSPNVITTAVPFVSIAPDARGLNYDKFYVKGTVHTEGDEAYTSHNTTRLDVDGVVKKIMGTDYVKEELEGRPHAVEA